MLMEHISYFQPHKTSQVIRHTP